MIVNKIKEICKKIVKYIIAFILGGFLMFLYFILFLRQNKGVQNEKNNNIIDSINNVEDIINKLRKN